MKVFVAIVPGAFGDVEAFGGVYASPEAAQRAYPGRYEEGVYSFSGTRFWRRVAHVEYDDMDEPYESDEGYDRSYSGRHVIIREEEVTG